MSESPTLLLREVFDTWREDLLHGEPAESWLAGQPGFDHIELAPGRIVLIGAPPGAGKTALVCQWAFDALRAFEDLKATICNVEMSPDSLLTRQLSRLSGLPLSMLRHRQTGPEHVERLEQGFDNLGGILERLAFVNPPYSLSRIAEVATETDSGLLVLDYAQRIIVDTGGPHASKKAEVDALMGTLRGFADAGVAVLLVAAVGRQRGQGGSSYNDLNLASFRESSELEYAVDDALLLVRKHREQEAVLQHVKCRHGEPRDAKLRFFGHVQRFEPEADQMAEMALAAFREGQPPEPASPLRSDDEY